MLRRKSVKPYTNRNGIQLKLVLREFKGFFFFFLSLLLQIVAMPFLIKFLITGFFSNDNQFCISFQRWSLYFNSPRNISLNFFFKSHKIHFQIWQIDRTELLAHRRPYKNDLGDTNQWDAKINNYICYASF